MELTETQTPRERPPRPTWGEAVRVFARIGMQSFGGPAGQIAVMHRILVEEKRWIGERRFLHALNYCMLLPGPEATQLATYVGWLLFRTRGGIMAGVLFVLPGALCMLALSAAYVAFAATAWIAFVLVGLQGAVIALVAEAVWRIGRRVLRTGAARAMAVGALLAIGLLHAPFPLVIACAAVIGWIARRKRPGWFGARGHDDGGVSEPLTVLGDDVPEFARPSWGRAARVLAVWLPLWLVPVGAVVWWAGRESVLGQQAVLFSSAAVVSFGGAYAVLAYIAQEAAATYAWILPGDVATGLGLAETTPGPLILVLQFLAFVGAHRAVPVGGAGVEPWAMGLAGTMVCLWATFVPCFLWIFLGAPYIERQRARAGLNGAMGAVSAAVVGVIAHLGVWLTVHTILPLSEVRAIGVLHVVVPRLEGMRVGPLVVAVCAAWMLLGWKWGIGRVLLGSVLIGAAWTALIG